MKTLIATLLCAAALGFGSAIAAPAPASPGPSAAPGPTSAPAAPNAPMLARAQAWLGMLQQGKIDRSQLTPAMDAAFTDDSIKTLAGEIGPFGAATSFAQSRIVRDAGNTAYIYTVTFKNGTKALMIFAIDDASGKISGIRLTPSE